MYAGFNFASAGCSVSVHPPTSCTANVISGGMYFLQSAFVMNDKMQDLVLASFPAIRYSLIDSIVLVLILIYSLIVYYFYSL